MNEMKKKRYPTDRLKLHALLEKKEKELVRLQEEVEKLRTMVQTADRNAIHATAELYNVTPEQLAEIMQSMFGDRVIPELPKDATTASAVSEYPVIPEEKEDSLDDEI